MRVSNFVGQQTQPDPDTDTHAQYCVGGAAKIWPPDYPTNLS